MEASDSKPLRLLMQIPGIEGPAITSVPARYKGWLSFSSFQHGAGLGIGSRRKRDDDDNNNKSDDEKGDKDEKKEEESDDEGIQVSDPSISEITLTRDCDAASTSLFGTLLARKKIPVIEIVMLKGQDVLFTYTLSDVLLSGYSQSFAAADEKPSRRGGRNRSNADGSGSESISLNFARISVASAASTMGYSTMGYDLIDNNVFINGEPSPDYEGRSEEEYKLYLHKLKQKGKTLEEAREEAKKKKKARGGYY